MEFKDRKAQHAGRIRLQAVDGQPNVYDVIAADGVTEQGTPLDAQTFAAFKEELLDKIANYNGVLGKNVFIKYNSFPRDLGASENWYQGLDYIGFAVASGDVAPQTGYKWAKFVGETTVRTVSTGIFKNDIY